MFSNILVVCVGNICRSPTGERVLQNLLPEKTVASAGIATKKSRLVGNAADAMAVQVASAHGLNIDNHKAQQLTAELCRHYDLILVMEKEHINALTEIAPEARGKAMLFGQWIGQKNIPDPYLQSKEAFEHVYQLINDAAQAWADKLR